MMTKIKKIDSSSNPLFKKLLSLTKSKGVKEEQLCLVSGEKVIAEQISMAVPAAAFWIFTSEEHDLFELQPDMQRVIVPKELFRELDIVGSHKPLACLPIPQVQKWNGEELPQSHELLCALGDPNNLGALLRSAKAFGINNIVLLEECCHPFHPKAIKSSSGACFGLNYFKGPSIKHLESVRKVLALDRAGKSVREYKWNEACRILLGEEGQGLPASIQSEKVSIPYPGNIESLNATVAASILFYELSKN
jgi:RNA methyltransferase, TrmH family